MTFSLFKWSAFALVPLLALACADDSMDESEEDLQLRSSPLVSLLGSIFEIDEDANLIEDHALTDWVGVNEIRKVDTVNPDDSYTGGAKEDDPCPSVGTDSIPPNKSDLRTFGLYVEEEPDGPGYLHLYWSRVQDPSGTTLMDFELNQSGEDCGNGVNRERTVNDILFEYKLAKGGTVPTIVVRFWTGTAWGPETDLTAVGEATGSINTSPIPANQADGLGALSARTFGEASIDLDAIFDEGRCVSFGSAMVKSRSSDSFTSALKDFIAPQSISLSNCGSVTIRKQTDPSGLTGFNFSSDLQTDPASNPNFTLDDGEFKTFSNVLFGTYTVTEDQLGPGYELTNVDCSDSVGVTPTVNVEAGTVTFTIDDVDDVVDCTFINGAKASIVIEKVSLGQAGTFEFQSPDLGDFSLATTASGQAGLASQTFSDLDPGVYSVSEVVPAGWMLSPPTCDDGSNPVTGINLSAGETVTCSFTNAPLTNITVSVDSLIDGATASTITCGPLSVETDPSGDGSLTRENLLEGTYTCTVDVAYN